MEFFLEVLFDLILEGSIEIGTSRKVPLVFRILALSLLVVVYGAFVVFLAVMAVIMWKDGSIVGSILVICIDVIFSFMVVLAVRKKYRERRNIK